MFPRLLSAPLISFPSPRTLPPAPCLQVLHESALVEAFNLKAAIEYQLKNSAWGQMECVCREKMG
jgi:hypothetical protein